MYMPKKGHKSQAGIGDLYETPKLRINLSLTEEAINLLENRSSAKDISRSELVERFARGTLELEFQAEEHEKLKAVNQIVDKWIKLLPPNANKLARWQKAQHLIEELLVVLEQTN
jgi:hypothetical protein